VLNEPRMPHVFASYREPVAAEQHAFKLLRSRESRQATFLSTLGRAVQKPPTHKRLIARPSLLLLAVVVAALFSAPSTDAGLTLRFDR
jgi:hypothetical protein